MSRLRMLPTLAHRPHLAVPVRRDPAGRRGPTKAEAEGPSWRSTSHGLYVPSHTVDSVEQRILEASAALPDHGAVTGWGGIFWQGGRRWFEGLAGDGTTRRPVCLAIGGQDVRPQSGIEVSAERLDPRDVIDDDGVRVTTAVRSVCFEMRYAVDVRAAARILSMAAYHDLVSIQEMAEYAGRHSGWTGIPRCRGALALAEENCWSPTELDVALVWRLDADLPRALCNRPIFDRSGGHLGTPDLLDEEAGLLIQYDGSLHLSGRQRMLDVGQEEAYRRAGLECLTVLSSHRSQPAVLAERMHTARARAAHAAPATRAWTIEQPSDWTPTHTVALRRQLTETQRRRFLRYRAA